MKIIPAVLFKSLMYHIFWIYQNLATNLAANLAEEAY